MRKRYAPAGATNDRFVKLPKAGRKAFHGTYLGCKCKSNVHNGAASPAGRVLAGHAPEKMKILGCGRRTPPCCMFAGAGGHGCIAVLLEQINFEM